MKKTLSTATMTALATLVIASPAAFAADDAASMTDNPFLKAVEGDVSANVAYTTDYRYRGISQTDRDFAIQGGFDYAMNSGFFLGTWASNVNNFNPSQVDGKSGTQAEIDFYGGYNYAINDNVSVGVQALYYYYPGASKAGPKSDVSTAGRELDFWEYTPSISFTGQNLSGSLSVSYSSDFYGEAGDAFYYSGDVSTDLTDWLTLGLHAGYQTVQRNRFWYDDYADWSATFSTNQFGLDWSVAYVDTDLNYDQCGATGCDATVVGTISKSF